MKYMHSNITNIMYVNVWNDRKGVFNLVAYLFSNKVNSEIVKFLEHKIDIRLIISRVSCLLLCED